MLYSENKEEFPTECQQVEFMDQCLLEIQNQLNVVSEIITKEKQTFQFNDEIITRLFNEFSNECQNFSKEPSHIFYITQIIFSTSSTGVKKAKEIFQSLFNELNIYLPDLINNIIGVRNNLYDNCNKMMSEIVTFISEHKKIENNYKKIKENLDEAQLNKKKIENDPKYAYNVSVKEKAEKKVIYYLQEMDKIFPKIQNFSKNLEEKKERFNSTLKDNFELIVMNTFKYLANLHQVFFLYSKNKYDQLNQVFEIFRNHNNNLASMSINLNDYSERKFGELQGVKYDGIDLIDFDDELLKTNPYQLINISNNIIDYTNIFLLSLRYRKKIMKIFKKKFPNYINDLIHYNEYNKQEKKKLTSFVENLKLIGEGTKRSWNIFFYSAPYLIENSGVNDIFKVIDEFITETRAEYYSFLDKWKKYEKKINDYKDDVQELGDSIRNERKLKSSQNKTYTNTKDDEKLKHKSEKLINLLKETIEFLNNHIPSIREKDTKLINKFVEVINSLNRIIESSINKLIETTQNEIEISTVLDIFDECSFLFSKYFKQFGITNYETFMEKIRLKILLKTDLQKEKIGQSAYEQLNDFSGFNSNSFLIDKKDSKIIFNDSSSSISDQTKEKELMIVEDFNNQINTDKKILQPMKKEISGVSNNLNLEENNNNITSNKIINDNNNIINNTNINNTTINNNNKEIDLKVNEDNKENLSKFGSKTKRNSDSMIYSLEDEDIDFVKKDKFKNYLEKKNPYQIFKEPELNELKNKAKNLKPKKTIEFENEETIIDSFSCAYKDKILLQGKLILTSKKLAFHSLFNSSTLFGKGGTTLIIPLDKITSIEKKSNLKIFPNSIEITTDKGKLFFTSFLFRNQCYNLIKTQLKFIESQKKEEEKKEEEEEEENQEEKSGKFPKLKLKKSKQISKLLQEIDFYNRIDKIHNERLELFNKTYTDLKNGIFLPIEKFPNKFIDNVALENCPLSIIFTYLWNPYTPIEEYEHNKGFYESILIDRNDSNIQFIDMKDNENNIENVPLYFSDTEYTLSLLSTFNKDDLDKFINDIQSWKHIYQYTYKYIHPIKKYFIGPDKVGENDNIKIYFISPKLLIVDLLSKGSDFPYCDTFIPITQYRFETNLKFNEKKGKFEFETKFSSYFICNILTSSMFQSTLESTANTQAHDSIVYNFLDKIKTISENQSQLFIEMFDKVSDETIQRKIIQKENFIEGIDDDNDDNFDDDDDDKNEIQIVKQVVSYDIKGDNSNNKQISKIKNLFAKYQKIFIFGFIFIIFVFLLILGVKFRVITRKNFNFNTILNIIMFGVIIYLILKNKK